MVTLERITEDLREVVAELEPDAYLGVDAARLLEPARATPHRRRVSRGGPKFSLQTSYGISVPRTVGA